MADSVLRGGTEIMLLSEEKGLAGMILNSSLLATGTEC